MVGRIDAEFLAAVAAGNVRFRVTGFDQHFGHLAEHFVADLVAVRVVELLEEVDVQEHESAGRALALPFAEPAFELVVEGAAIRQIRSANRFGLRIRAL